MTTPPKGEILVESRRFGAILRVTAVDSVTGTEIVFQAPQTTPPESIRAMAFAKMSYVLKKKPS